MVNLTGLLGIIFVGISCLLLSRNRGAIDWRTVLWGLVLQISFALLIIRGDSIAELFSFFPLTQSVFLAIVACQVLALWLVTRYAPTLAARLPMVWVRRVVWAEAIFYLLRFNVVGAIFESLKTGAAQVLKFSGVGASFVFGVLGSEEAMRASFTTALGDKAAGIAFVFAFQVLPTIIFVASIFSVLYYLNVMQPLIRSIAKFINRFMHASGAETLDVAANIFMGQTEAPLTIKPYLAGLTRSELFTVMVSGMAHCSAGILIVYVAVAGVDAKHLLASVIMTAPGSIMLAKMVFPETGLPETAQGGAAGSQQAAPPPVDENRPVNFIDAAARGASEGLLLAANVAAMLIAFIALIALVNGIWAAAREAALAQTSGALHGFFAAIPATIQQVLGLLFAPVAFVAGVPWSEAVQVGNLLGTRIVLNEFVGYIELGKIREVLSPKAFLISTYMLCGFGSLTSIAIQAGGIGALVPQRRAELASLGFLAVVVGVLSNILAASIAGILF
ncbi:MAG: nucleoside transporter C-terminal domain-containing protein [Turneriella sp.]